MDRANLMTSLSEEMDKCSDIHNNCLNCPKKQRCVEIWDCAAGCDLALKYSDLICCIKLFRSLWESEAPVLSTGRV
jgi:hypothetical protein